MSDPQQDTGRFMTVLLPELSISCEAYTANAQRGLPDGCAEQPARSPYVEASTRMEDLDVSESDIDWSRFACFVFLGQFGLS